MQANYLSYLIYYLVGMFIWHDKKFLKFEAVDNHNIASLQWNEKKYVLKLIKFWYS